MLKYAALGIIQGMTEFLPVSSSGHLVIIQNIFNNENQIALSVVLHLGTALALITFFFKEILKLWRDTKTLLMILLVTLITGIIALSGRGFFERLFSSSPKFVATALIFTGIVLLFTRKFMDTKRSSLNFKDAFIIGLSQGLSIIPGISRSGMTISTLLFRGIDRQTSFKFSFLAAIPAVFGAAILEAKEIGFAIKGDPKNFVVGFGFALCSGILSLWILKTILIKAKLYYFGYYCILVAIITLLLIK